MKVSKLLHFKQGDQERELGMPIMPLMDRTRDSAPSSQGFFLEKLVQPLLEPFCFFLHHSVADSLLSNLRLNKENWAELVRKHGKKTAGEIIPEEDAEEAEEGERDRPSRAGSQAWS